MGAAASFDSSLNVSRSNWFMCDNIKYLCFIWCPPPNWGTLVWGAVQNCQSFPARKIHKKLHHWRITLAPKMLDGYTWPISASLCSLQNTYDFIYREYRSRCKDLLLLQGRNSRPDRLPKEVHNIIPVKYYQIINLINICNIFKMFYMMFLIRLINS